MNLLGLGLSQSRFSPRKLRPSLYLSADRGVYQDAAVQFTAADKSWLRIADADQTGLDLGTDDALLCGWVWLDVLSSTYSLFGRLHSLHVFTVKSGYVKCDFGPSGSIKSAQTDAGALTTSKWAHVAVYADRSGLLTIYIDGEAAATGDISSLASNNVDTSYGFAVGASSAGGLFLDGRIDSLMFFKKPDLSPYAADIIAWAYNSGAGRLCAEITDEQKAAWGAVSGWEFAEASGTRADSWGDNDLDETFGELVTNGGFDTDVSGWTHSYSVADSVSGGVSGNCLLLTADGDSSSNRSYQPIPTAIGGTYKVSVSQKNGTSTGQIRIGHAANSSEYWSQSVDNANWTQYTKTFTASASKVYITLRGDGVDGSTVYYDSVSMVRTEIARAPGIVRAIAANGDGVSYWRDQSTGSKHATQITLAKRPALVTSGINSRPVIRGDGVDDYLGVSAVSLTGAFTISAVFACEAMPSNLTLLGKDANNYVKLTDNTTVTVCFAGTSQAFTVGAMGTDPHILTVTRDADDAVNVCLDGTVSTIGAKTLAGTLAVEQVMAHGSEYFAGDIADVLVYDGEKSAAELARIHTYLARRYGITI